MSPRKRNTNKNESSKPSTEPTVGGETKSDKTSVFTWKILLRRFFFTIALLGIVYFASYNRKQEDAVIVFVKHDEVTQRRSHQVQCSSDYNNEQQFQGCLPKICGRVVTDSLITQEEADQLLQLAKKGLSFGGSEGGASILDLHSGALSKGREFINVYKISESSKIFSDSDFNIYRKVKTRIHHTIAMEFGALANQLYLTHPTFFSKITAKPAKTLHDEYWHPHVDKETYKSFHYTSLLYLTDYSKDFSGGQFVFIDKKVNATVQPKKGRLVMFTSGSENLHRVEKVTRGERFALTISFTCNPKHAVNDIGPK